MEMVLKDLKTYVKNHATAKTDSADVGDNILDIKKIERKLLFSRGG